MVSVCTTLYVVVLPFVFTLLWRQVIRLFVYSLVRFWACIGYYKCNLKHVKHFLKVRLYKILFIWKGKLWLIDQVCGINIEENMKDYFNSLRLDTSMIIHCKNKMSSIYRHCGNANFHNNSVIRTRNINHIYDIIIYYF